MQEENKSPDALKGLRSILEKAAVEGESEKPFAGSAARARRLASAGKKPDSEPGQKFSRPEPSDKSFEVLSFFAGRLAAAPFSIMAQYTGHSHWELDNSERRQLSSAVEAVGSRYFPLLFEEHKEIAALVVAVFALSIPRVVQESALRAAKRAKRIPVVERPKPRPEDEEAEALAKAVEFGEAQESRESSGEEKPKKRGFYGAWRK